MENNEIATVEEQNKIAEIKESLNLNDKNSILGFGVTVQKEIGDVPNVMLKNVKNKDLGETGHALTELAYQMKRTNEPDKKANLLTKFFNKTKKSVTTMATQYSDVSTNIDNIGAELEANYQSLVQSNSDLDAISNQNSIYEENVTYTIKAGQERLQEMKEVDLPKYQEAAKSGDFRDIQALSSAKDNYMFLEKRLKELITTKQVAIQSDAQIKTIQRTNMLLAEKVNNTLVSAIPLWKSQLNLRMNLENQKKISDAELLVTDITNKLLTDNSNYVKENTKTVIEQSNNSEIKVENLEKVQNDLSETLEFAIKATDINKNTSKELQERIDKMNDKYSDTLQKNVQLLSNSKGAVINDKDSSLR